MPVARAKCINRWGTPSEFEDSERLHVSTTYLTRNISAASRRHATRRTARGRRYIFRRIAGWWQRLLLAVFAACVVVGAWTAGRWFIGNAVASNAIDRSGAESALRWSEDDPQAQYMMAQMVERRAEGFDPIANVRAALPFYERATQLAPNDYRFWIELGRARERAGDIAGATDTLRRAGRTRARLRPTALAARQHLVARRTN
jgi:cytochrome c-type biogenesis protein CcmH/NrfG